MEKQIRISNSVECNILISFECKADHVVEEMTDILDETSYDVKETANIFKLDQAQEQSILSFDLETSNDTRENGLKTELIKHSKMNLVSLTRGTLNSAVSTKKTNMMQCGFVTLKRMLHCMATLFNCLRQITRGGGVKSRQQICKKEKKTQEHIIQERANAIYGKHVDGYLQPTNVPSCWHRSFPKELCVFNVSKCALQPVVKGGDVDVPLPIDYAARHFKPGEMQAAIVASMRERGYPKKDINKYIRTGEYPNYVIVSRSSST